ncbi:MAG: hypothetical protein AVDCRST_MAG41-208, partial [uncultured Corynebacteriales bacterium]
EGHDVHQDERAARRAAAVAVGRDGEGAPGHRRDDHHDPQRGAGADRGGGHPGGVHRRPVDRAGRAVHRGEGAGRRLLDLRGRHLGAGGGGGAEVRRDPREALAGLAGRGRAPPDHGV